MSQIKTKIENKNVSWSARMRFRVGSTCEHNSANWVNVTGGNGEPGVSGDWLKKDALVEVLDVLTSTETNKPLSANQGRALKALIDAIQVPAISDNLTTTDATKTLSANQGKILKDYIDAINGILASDDVTLDELQEVVNYIKANREDLANLSISNIAGLVGALAGKQKKLSSDGSLHIDHNASEIKVNGELYISSLHGLDTNSGTKPNLALKTIEALASKLPLLNEGGVVRFVDTEEYRNHLEVSGKSNVIVDLAGAKINSFTDILPGAWTAKSGYSNVFTHSNFIHYNGSDANYDFILVVAANNNLGGWTVLTKVDSLAICQSTPASYFVEGTGTGNATLNLHPIDSIAPATSQITYAATSKARAVSAGSNSVVKNAYAVGAVDG